MLLRAREHQVAVREPLQLLGAGPSGRVEGMLQVGSSQEGLGFRV